MKDSYSATTYPNPGNVGGEIVFTVLCGALWQSRWLILVFAALSVVIAHYYVSRVAVPLYPATATVALQEDKSEVISDIESIMLGRPITKMGINTELEVLRSRDFVGQLVDKLDLVSQPVFNQNLRQQSLFSRLKTQLLRQFGATLKVQQSVPNSDQVRSNVISSVLDTISVSNIRNTLVIKISVTTTDAARSVLMANTLAELYIENQIQVKLEALASATEFLSSRTSELKQSFEDLKKEMVKFSDKSDIVSPVVLDAQKAQLRELRLRLAEAEEHLVGQKTKQASLRSLREAGDLESLINTANEFHLNRAISLYRKQLMSRADFEQKVGHFMLQIKAEEERQEEQFIALKESEAVLSDRIERQSQELIVHQQLERETEAARLLYESFFNRLQEMNVQLGLETADGRLLSKAIQTGASGPKKNQTLFLAGIIGLMMGAGLVLLRELRFTGFRTTNELRDNSGFGVLASVPLIPARNRRAVISYLKDKPNSLVSEAVRNLRTSILMSNVDRVPQVIMLTSSIPGEGKTILTFALAQNMVGLGKRVLLIEADIRRHVYTVDIDRRNTVALLDLLTDKIKHDDVSLFVEELGFSILTGTKSDINAADLFASERFSNLLTELRKEFDYILIDTSPVLSVPDARVIGAISDANIYIVAWNKTTRAQVHQGLEMLSSVGVGTTGLVLNQINTKKMKFYGYTAQYGYDAYGSEYYDS
ncbi:MAG: AAA family ATPase [Porticoccaceae bacterium]|nr:AAA family ATPase [Porticoccaceae bacterium]